jgi:hypothetical protein
MKNSYIQYGCEKNKFILENFKLNVTDLASKDKDDGSMEWLFQNHLLKLSRKFIIGSSLFTIVNSEKKKKLRCSSE